MRRRVIKQGNNTLTITLPRKWTEQRSIKAGDELDVDETGAELRIHPGGAPLASDKTIDLKDAEFAAARVLTQCYKQGYANVHLVFSSPKVARALQDEVRKTLMTYEVLNVTRTSCTVQSLSQERPEDFDMMLRKVFQVTIAMAENGLEQLSQGKVDGLEEIASLEGANNRFTAFCHRIISQHGYKSPNKATVMYTVIWQLEKIADELKFLLQHVARTQTKITKSQSDNLKEAIKMLQLLYAYFYKPEMDTLHSVTTLRKSLTNRINAEFGRKGDVKIDHHTLVITEKVFDLSGPLIALTL